MKTKAYKQGETQHYLGKKKSLKGKDKNS